MMNAKQRRLAKRRVDRLVGGPLVTRSAAADVCADCGIFEDVTVRGIDEKARSATFVAATETGVRSYYGREYLRMAGARLQRYRSNNVVLDAHNRYEVGAIIGKAEVKIDAENRQLLATITFAETDRAETVWQLVKGGFVKALSVGFIPDESKTVRLEEGQTDGEGDNQVQGPARVVKAWELFEISVVPVPADPNALRRMLERNVDFLRNFTPEPKEDVTMAGENKDNKTQAQPANPPADPAKPGDELASERAAREAKAQAETAKARADVAVHLRAQVDAVIPATHKHRALADQMVLEGKPFEEIRAAVLKADAEGKEAVGTAEPAEIVPTKGGTDAGGKGDGAERAEPKSLKDVDDELLLRSF